VFQKTRGQSAHPKGTTTASTKPSGGSLDDILKGPLGDLLRGGAATGKKTGGGLGDLLKGPLGGVLGGAAAGTVLNGGLGDLLNLIQQNGQGDVVNSWVGSGPNKTISPTDITNALGAVTLDELWRGGRVARQGNRSIFVTCGRTRGGGSGCRRFARAVLAFLSPGSYLLEPLRI